MSPAPDLPALAATARAWLDVDPDPEDRTATEALLGAAEAGDTTGLVTCFGASVALGTAGFRAPMGPGPGRLNRLTVRRIARGLAATLPPGGAVVVGHDARKHSAAFAADAVAVLVAAGHPVTVLQRPLPTPVLAHAVAATGAAAGLMVTASHNPPADNGVKVYAAGGRQLDPAREASLLEAVAAADPLAPLAAGTAPRDGADGAVQAYLDDIVTVVAPDGPRDLRCVYTPLHGVGREVLERAFAAVGFPAPHVVAAQAEPDPAFPTTPYPNPEEPGALRLAVADATRLGADVVLANDPDADRLGVVVPDPTAPDGWTALTGDEIGALLAEHLLGAEQGPDRLVVTTFASSRLLAELAAVHGVRYVETPTGFKWVMRAVDEHPEARLVLAYEEALGFAVTDAVRDKDGISAALVVAELVAARRAAGETVWHTLADLARRHGLHRTRTEQIRLTGHDASARARQAVARLGAAPPRRLAGHQVRDVGSLTADASSVVLHLVGGGRIVARPSGTEPKLKLYVEVVAPFDGDGGVEELLERRAAAGAMTEEVATALRGWLGVG